jgi:hypothetical protein
MSWFSSKIHKRFRGFRWNGGSFRAQGRRSQHGAGSLATGCTPITGGGHGRDYYTHYFRGYPVHQHLLVLLQRRSSQEGGGGEPAEGPSCLGGRFRRRDRGSGPSSSSLISEVSLIFPNPDSCYICSSVIIGMVLHDYGQQSGL